jgi:enoyl-CoA hydratase
MNASVRVEKLGPVTVVTLDRPEVRNAVDFSTARALYEAFLTFDADEEALVAVFHGAHGHFCAGWDLQFGAQMARELGSSAADVLGDLDFTPAEAGSAGDPKPPNPPAPMGPSRLLLSKPVIAAVSGAAVAGGMELALWCDMRVMEEDAYFGVYCRRWGIPLIDGGTVRLPRLVGQGRALDIILTGRKVPAEEAYRIGLAERIAPKHRSREVAEALAHEIARFPQACVRADRRSVYRAHVLPVAAALRSEWQTSVHVLEEEGVAGAARFSSGKGRGGDFGAI